MPFFGYDLKCSFCAPRATSVLNRVQKKTRHADCLFGKHLIPAEAINRGF